MTTLSGLYKRYCNAMRRSLYGPLVGSYTEVLYRRFLEGCADNATILDIGIGDGSSLCKSADVIKRANLHIVGIDICKDSINDCLANISTYGLEEHVEVGLADEMLRFCYPSFDYAYLSNSYSVIDDIGSCIDMALQETKDAQCVISLALYSTYSPIAAFVKRNLHRFLGFACGRYITHASLNDELASMNLIATNKEFTCSNKLFGVSIADVYTLTIARNIVFADDGDDDSESGGCDGKADYSGDNSL